MLFSVGDRIRVRPDAPELAGQPCIYLAQPKKGEPLATIVVDRTVYLIDPAWLTGLRYFRPGDLAIVHKHPYPGLQGKLGIITEVQDTTDEVLFQTENDLKIRLPYAVLRRLPFQEDQKVVIRGDRGKIPYQGETGVIKSVGPDTARVLLDLPQNGLTIEASVDLADLLPGLPRPPTVWERL